MAIDATGARANILSTLNNNNKVKPSETSQAGEVKPNPESSKPSESSDVKENVSLTGMAQRLKTLEDSLLDIPVVDDDRVSSLKEQISNGSYQINAERIADKMIDLESMF
jgi:negative regulator of flagellin synthesis FlgM